MEIKSKTSLEQTIDPDTIIHFPNGIPGFEDQIKFQLYNQKDSKIVFLLQSQDNNIAFSVAHPSHFNINYNFVLTDEEQKILEIESFDDLLILIILDKDDSPDASGQPTVKGSLNSPILINIKKRIGLQKLLEAVEQSITLTEKNSEIEVSEI